MSVCVQYCGDVPKLCRCDGRNMNILKRIWCRTYQTALYVGMSVMPWREPRLIVGENSFDGCADAMLADGVRNAFVVCDKAAMQRHALDAFFEGADGCGLRYVVYDEVQPNPTVKQVERGLELYLSNGCDGILAFGGGSAMDCAKAIGARVVRPNKTVNKMKGLLKVRKKLPPFFAVPTTAGTGSECTVAAVITDSDAHDKYAINDFALIPHCAVLDPVLTVGLPPFLTATTGMDALTHAVEAYIGRANTRTTRRNAEEAVRLIFDNLAAATENGTDLSARQGMQRVAYLAGLAFTRAYVGYVHALAHALGGKYNTPHGLANAVLLPVVLRAFGKSAHKPLARLARAAGLAQSGDSAAVAAEKFIAAVEALNCRLGIPNKIEGIMPQDIAELARHAEREANPLYPVPRLMTATELENIYKQVM